MTKIKDPQSRATKGGEQRRGRFGPIAIAGID